MSTPNADGRITAARGLTAEIAEIVRREGPNAAVWYRRLRDIGVVLAQTGQPAQDLLAEAAELLDAMYSGGRNFADFHIYRDDPAQRVAADEQLSELIDELTATLRAQ